MAAEIITTDDLREFKLELLADIQKLLQGQSVTQARKWLKSKEVRQILNISPGTLQNLRKNGTLPYTRIGGVIYYAFSDIHKMIEKNKIN